MVPRWQKSAAILVFYLAIAGLTLFRELHSGIGAIEACLVCGASSAAAMWFAIDASERRLDYAVRYQWFAFWFWFAFLPGYLLATRGARRGSVRVLLAAVGFLAASAIGELSVVGGRAVGRLLS
jgi:hypothetical protein